MALAEPLTGMVNFRFDGLGFCRRVTGVSDRRMASGVSGTLAASGIFSFSCEVLGFGVLEVPVASITIPRWYIV